jgi:hypothetical protein
MAYDAATGIVVLFGGSVYPRFFDDTWTWNGRTWTHQAPATHPSARGAAPMAYDTATGQAVLFGGDDQRLFFDGTWTWGDAP